MANVTNLPDAPRKAEPKVRHPYEALVAALVGANPESMKGKILLLFLDKVIVGAAIGLAFWGYSTWRADKDAKREQGLVEMQLRVERARVSSEYLPVIVDRTTDIVVRSHLLSTALSAELIDPDVAIELLAVLHSDGLPNSHLLRTARVALPAGLAAVARHGTRLEAEVREHGDPSRSAQVKALPGRTGGQRYVAASGLSAKLQAAINERLLWATALRATLPQIPEREEREIVTRRFLTEHIGSLYFLVQPMRASAAEELFGSSSITLRLVGALDCVLQGWGPTLEAANQIGLEFSALDFESEEDLLYAQALVEVLLEYGFRPDVTTVPMTPHIAIHLAQLLVDDTFRHRIAWLPVDASTSHRREWWAEASAADTFSSLQYTASNVLRLMKDRAQRAEKVLVPFVEEFVREVTAAKSPEELTLISSRYGNYPLRTAIAVLNSLESETSRAAVQEVLQLGDEKLGAFEGIGMEFDLGGFERSRTK